MAKSIVSIRLVLICFLVAIFGCLWAANTVGLLDVKSIAAKTPFLGKYIHTEEQEGIDIPVLSPIERENLELREAIKGFEEKIGFLESDTAEILQENEKLQEELEELKKYKEEKEKAILNAEELSLYYREMKPEEVVKIMDNLDNETILLILTKLERNQAGEIMAQMEPQRAALITQLLLGHSEDDESQ